MHVYLQVSYSKKAAIKFGALQLLSFIPTHCLVIGPEFSIMHAYIFQAMLIPLPGNL